MFSFPVAGERYDSVGEESECGLLILALLCIKIRILRIH